MSKKKSKFSLEHLKKKFSGLFKKSSPREGDEEFYEEDIDYQEDFDEESEGEWADETDPSFKPLTITDIKRQQVESGENPPDLPPNDLLDLEEDGEDYDVDESTSILVTNPSLTEFDVPPIKRSIGSKLKDAFQELKSKIKASRKAPSFAREGSKPLSWIQNINFDEIFNNIFSPQNRPIAHRSFLAVFFILSSFLVGRMISGLLTPAPSGKVAATKTALALNKNDVLRKKLADIKSNDLFQAPEELSTPVIGKQTKKDDFKEEKICLKASRKSSLGIKLVNTVILQDSVKSLASVQVRGKDDFLREGDSIPNMIEVGKISRKMLVFKNLKTRQCEYIENAEKSTKTAKPLEIVREPKKAKKLIEDTKITGISQVGNNFKIKKEVRQRMLENISEVLTQARAVQIKNPDGSLAFRMQEIVPGSIYSQLNIQEGDMITGINGKKITNMAEMMNLFGQIDKIDHFELSLEREGVEQNLEYDFE